MPEVHPVLPFLAAIAIAPFAGAMGRRIIALLAPALALGALWALPDGARSSITVLGHDWVLLRLDALGRLFATAFSLYAFIASWYSWTRDSASERVSALGLAGAGVGVSLAGDLLTLFLFWELLSVTSFFLVSLGRSRRSGPAAIRYLYFHVAGGMSFLGGIVLLLAGESGLGLEPVLATPGAWTPAVWLILIGLAANAAVPPLHAWIADAYPEATIQGTVFLAAFTSKAAVYALARLFPGVELLVGAGALMGIWGTVYALLENDIRRLLVYSIISQVGYMVAGIGLGSELGVSGAAAHAVSHIMYKGLLLMAAGAVIHATGRGKLTELGGLARPLRWVLVLYAIGALSISAAPFFNGFATKSLIVSAATEAHRGTLELILLIASTGTFLHTGLRVPWFTFFSEDRGARVERSVPASMYGAMVLAASVCIVTGALPGILYSLLPHPIDYDPYTTDHVVGSLELLLGGAVGFTLLGRLLRGRDRATLDVDRLYRRPLASAVSAAGRVLDSAGGGSARLREALARGAWTALSSYRARRRPSLAYEVSIILAVLAALAYFALSLRS